MTSTEIILYLLRTALREPQGKLGSGTGMGFATVDWSKVMDVAFEQGVAGVCFDALELLPENMRPDMDSLMEWYGQTSYMEQDYAEHRRCVEELAGFYAANGIRMMLLKGYGLSKYWPKPNHRPAGDIDIYLKAESLELRDESGEPAWRRGDRMVKEKLGIEVDNGHHHHSVFGFQGTMVENHYDFINVHSHRSNVWIERLFKELAEKGHEADEQMEGLCYPQPTLNALFVARHAGIHFASEKMTLRQLLDWGFMVRARHEEVDWNLFWPTVERMGMKPFVLCMNRICVRHLGFSSEVFHEPADAVCSEGLAERMLADIFEPEDTGSEKKGLSYVAHRARLWWRNRWKHKMVYSDSLLSTFCAQVGSHLMKPKTIFGK